MPPPRQYLAFLAIAVISLVVLILHSASDAPRHSWRSLTGALRKHPDFERYHHLHTLSPDEFPIDDPNRRVIIVGDIHGMDKPFEKLLKKVGYNPQSDVLVHVGDVLTRGPHNGSVAVIDFLTAHNVTGVRGNHDQKIIAWRGWMDWFTTLDGGKEWLSDLRSKWLAGRARGQSLKSWVKEQRKESHGKDARWWGYVPEDWIPFGDHYRIAERLTEAQYSYLLSLPLKIHIPSAHAFIIHAGLLPFDVRYDYDDHRRQPLARVPRTPAYSLSHSSNKIENLRNLQELAVLQRVPQNTDPWVNLNMRSVTKKKKISRNTKGGTPWAKYWNDQMSMCNGFDQGLGVLHIPEEQRLLLDAPDISSGKKSLPCYPASVIYGHAAARGLDIGRWTFGLDSGCVYGRKLSAMIIGPNPLPREAWEEDDDDDDNDNDNDNDDDDEPLLEHWLETDEVLEDLERGKAGVDGAGDESLKKAKTIKFGEHTTAKIVQVSCS